jgi:hypothetical protein
MISAQGKTLNDYPMLLSIWYKNELYSRFLILANEIKEQAPGPFWDIPLAFNRGEYLWI